MSEIIRPLVEVSLHMGWHQAATCGRKLEHDLHEQASRRHLSRVVIHQSIDIALVYPLAQGQKAPVSLRDELFLQRYIMRKFFLGGKGTNDHVHVPFFQKCFPDVLCMKLR